MKQIRNEKYKENIIQENDIFVCAFGYEKRSLYLFDKIKSKMQNDNILVFFFDDYSDEKKINELKRNEVNCIESTYNSGKFVQNTICSFVEKKRKDNSELRVHIDYSSMPRSWYYNLPILLNKYKGKTYFWYVVGKYPIDYTAYPTAGIDTYTIIGKPSLRTEEKRVHVFGLSYDSIRTKAIISEIDPDSYITCNAFDRENAERGENVNKLNQQIISKAVGELSFCFEDFSFMFSKLCEIAIEYSDIGSIIFVPDGPKPLIFAMSLVVLYLNKEGISCIHIHRNDQCQNHVDVDPCDIILGFSV